MMKDSTKALMVLVLLGAVAAVPCVTAQDEDEDMLAEVEIVQPKVVELTGTVIVTRDDDEAITGVVLKVGAGGDVVVALDQNGKKLAKAAEGATVQVTGSIAVADGVKTITVQKFAVVEDEEEAAE